MIEISLPTPEAPHLKEFSSNKPAQKNHLARKRLLEHLSRQYQKYSIIVLQAQTGQGKTILAQQFVSQHLQHQQHHWQTLQHTDQNPTHFVQHLHTHLQQALPYFHHQSQQKQNGSLALEQLLNDLDKQLSEPFYLILDDLYQVIGSPSETLLLQILQQRPDNLQLILLSRIQLQSLLKQNRPPAHWLVVNNQQQAFNHEEVKQLHAQHFDIYLSDEESQLIHQHTQGWPLGIESYAQQRQEGEISFSELNQQLQQSQSFYDTFQTAFNQQINSELQEFSLKIAFLDHLTPALACTISGDANAADKLQQLLTQQIFITPPLLGQDRHQLMPLWRSFLRQQANRTLEQTKLANLHHKVADYWQQHNDPQQALLYYLKADASEIIETLLAKKGAQILHLSQNREIHHVLIERASEQQEPQPWLALLLGSELNTHNPSQALHFLRLAEQGFQQHNAHHGELLAQVQQLYFHLCIDGDQQQLQRLLPQVEQRFAQLENQLCPYDRIYSSSLLILSQTLLKPTQQNDGLDHLIQLSHSHKLVTLELHLHLCRLLEQMLKGQLELAKRDLEQLHQTLIEQQGSALERALIFTTIAFYLSHTAPYPLFEQFLQQSKRLTDPSALQNSLCAPLLLLWQANAHLAQGRQDLAIPALRQAIGLCQAVAQSPLHPYLNSLKKHLTGQFSSLSEGSSVASLLLQAITQGEQQAYAEAEISFARAERQANAQHNHWLLSGVLMHWSAMLIHSQQETRVKPLLLQLAPLKQSPSRSYLFIPIVAKTVFSYAVGHKIEMAFYRQRAKQQVSIGFNDKNEAIPLLKIQSLGTLTLLFDEECSLNQSELTPKQQILLALLLASSELHLDQSTVLQALWPDSSECNSRHKLDVMLSRFRGIFNKAFQPQRASNYISLKHGVLSLKNVEADIHHFSKAGQLGLKLYKRGDHWQASLELQSALQLWHGRFCPGIATLYSVADLRENLLTHHQRYCIALADIYERWQRYEEASELLLPLFNANPGDEALVATLYRLFSHLKQRHKAAQVLHSYREFLDQSGFDDNETISLVIGMRDRAREGMF